MEGGAHGGLVFQLFVVPKMQNEEGGRGGIPVLHCPPLLFYIDQLLEGGGPCSALIINDQGRQFLSRSGGMKAVIDRYSRNFLGLCPMSL